MTLEEVQQSELETLLIFRDFCEEHNLRYYLAFGTLLGAVRHQGFIPWDVDVDVLMPRKDYEYFRAHFNDEARNGRWADTGGEPPAYYLRNDSVIIDKRTVLFDHKHADGAWIDVFPLDYLVENTFTRLKKFIPILICESMVKYLAFDPAAKHSRLGLLKYRILTALIPKDNLPSKEEWATRRWNHLQDIRVDESRICGFTYFWVGIWAVLGLKRDCFDPPSTQTFEACTFSAPHDSETFLRYTYGSDWNVIPPENKRRIQDLKFYWKED